MFLSILLVLLSAVIAVYLYVKRCYSFWSDRGVPFIEPKFPYGNIKEAEKRIQFSLLLAEFYSKSKSIDTPIIGLYFFLRPVVLVTDLKFAQKVLIRDFHHFSDRGMYHNQKDDPLTANLIRLEAAEWKPRRAKVSPTFTSGRMKFMFPTVVSVGQEFVKCVLTMIKCGNELEIRDLLSRFTTDVIGKCAFGIECNSLKDPNTKFRQMSRKAVDQPKTSIFSRLLLASNQNLARFLGLRLTRPDVSDFFLNIVEQTVEYREQNKVKREDFMELMMQLKNYGKLKDEAKTGDGHLTILEIAAEAFVFFIAGFETSSYALMYALFELAHNKHIQDKARKEINNVLAKYDGQLTYEGLNEMCYIEQIVNESMRKYPPVPILGRIVTKDYQCTEAKVVLKKGMGVAIPVYAIHHDPDIYEQPDEFRPERFSKEEIKKRPSCTFLPFGDGPRICVGMRFAMMQVRIGLVMLLKHFQFSTCDRTPSLPMPISPTKSLLTPVGGMWLNIQVV